MEEHTAATSQKRSGGAVEYLRKEYKLKPANVVWLHLLYILPFLVVQAIVCKITLQQRNETAFSYIANFSFGLSLII